MAVSQISHFIKIYIDIYIHVRPAAHERY